MESRAEKAGDEDIEEQVYLQGEEGLGWSSPEVYGQTGSKRVCPDQGYGFRGDLLTDARHRQFEGVTCRVREKRSGRAHRHQTCIPEWRTLPYWGESPKFANWRCDRTHSSKGENEV
ncbi:hypothetical protein NDN08_001323 [Rhodosorus marinus]|uniref:Uncharacterized protein n=1 Tax=Rhodosorus marinus TaxID=101924 RepID=A0AAV8UUN0_9RHOD|nr:hypothetical protein NDN08_001323 [Rhodosorus marinus]